jgi:hypothetical protein
MEKYIILRVKAFEKAEKYQKRVNDQAAKGYKAISITSHGNVVLMEKISQ